MKIDSLYSFKKRFRIENEFFSRHLKTKQKVRKKNKTVRNSCYYYGRSFRYNHLGINGMKNRKEKSTNCKC